MALQCGSLGVAGVVDVTALEATTGAQLGRVAPVVVARCCAQSFVMLGATGWLWQCWPASLVVVVIRLAKVGFDGLWRLLECVGVCLGGGIRLWSERPGGGRDRRSMKNEFPPCSPSPKVVAFGFVWVGCSTQSSGNGKGGAEPL